MAKEMIVSVNGREKKIAILDNGKVTEFYIERGEENSGIAGNIYKGRVQRVLPGMQSAFVSIGLERDAFLYVSDFFDEEEEIERIVMEKSKKSSPEEAKREANEQIDRARVTREKQMESVQELAEPLAADTVEDQAEEPQPAAEVEDDRGRRAKGGRGRGRKDPAAAAAVAIPAEAASDEEKPVFNFEFEDSGFERVIDDTDTGEMFKDAFVQEAIVDQVRAVEFDMESTAAAEVGSLLGSLEQEAGGFERIADEDDEETAAAPKGGKGRGKKASAKSPAKPRGKKAKAEENAAIQEATGDEETAKPAKGKGSRGRKKASKEEVIEDAEASMRESADTAEMSVRRGGRGRRRGGRNRRNEGDAVAAGPESDAEDNDTDVSEGPEAVAETEESRAESNGNVETEKPEPPTEAEPAVEARAPRGSGYGREARGGSDNRRDGGENRGRGPRENRDSRDNRDNRDNRESRDRGRGQSDGRKFDRGDRRDRPAQPTISDLLREGQEILVQIAKEPIARKGARITSHIALPGRFLVYMPTIEHLGVSRKIESSSERGRLRTLIQRIRQDEDIPSGGFIVRTAGIGISEEDLRQDARYLVRTWQDIKKTSEKAKSPAMVHQDLDIVQRLLRDQMSDEFTAIRVDSEEEYLRTVEFMNRIQPRMVNRVKLYTREEPILDAYGVQEEIDKALKPRVWLKSGGYLVINQTEALVAIDVNTGKFVGKGNARLEDTITRTNMEAVDEIARQIRLRDLGGIIVLDLIDMEDRRNRHKVSQALQEALSSDKSPTKVLSFNDFGLIIMTRKRVKQSLERTLCTVCEYCEGSGWVKSPQTICFEILSEAARLGKHLEDVKQTTLRVHPEVATALRSSEREILDEIEAHVGPVDITADPHIHQAQYDFAFV